MLTEAEREKVFYTRGFRNFCFRVGKANPYFLFCQFLNIIYFCFLFLILFAISEFKITWYTKLYFFICFSSIIIKYFWGTWLAIIIRFKSVLFQLIQTEKQQKETQNSPSEWLEIFLQKIINEEILVIDLGDGFALYQKQKLIVFFYKGFFYDMDYYKKFKKVFFEPESAIQQLNNNSIPKEYFEKDSSSLSEKS